MDRIIRTRVLLLVLGCSFGHAMVRPVDARAGRGRSARSRRRARRERRRRRRTAKRLFEKAEKKYNLAQFETALKLYSRAYELVSLPGFLFNIAQCHRNLENYKKAIFFYRQYLGKARRVGNRKTVLELIAESKKKLEAKQARLEAARRRAEQKKLEADKRREAGRKRREEEARKAAARVAHKSDPLMTEPAERDKGQSPFYERWWFWTAIGSGVVAAVATGLALGLTRNTQTVLPAGDMGTIDAR